jgi:hypothetical protein
MLRSFALHYPYWFLYEMVINLYGLVRWLFFEDQKLRKLIAMVIGTWDGLMQRMGPIVPSRQALLEPPQAEAGG